MIMSPMRINTIPSILLNHHFSSDIMRIFAIINRPPRAMSVSIHESPKAYTRVYPIPRVTDTGKTVARRSE